MEAQKDAIGPDGQDAMTVGDVSSGIACEDFQVNRWVLKNIYGEYRNTVTPSDTGELTVFIETYGGFEGQTTLLYDQLCIKLAVVP